MDGAENADEVVAAISAYRAKHTPEETEKDGRNSNPMVRMQHGFSKGEKRFAAEPPALRLVQDPDDQQHRPVPAILYVIPSFQNK